MRPLNLLLKFLLELAAFAGLAVAGWHAGSSIHVAVGVVAAVAAPAAAIAVWAKYAAPRASARLPLGPRVALELGVFALAGAALAAAGHPGLAMVFAGLVLVNAIGLTAFRQWES